MLALSIIGCLLAAIIILLLIPARLYFQYKGNVLKAELKYLFLRFDFIPKEEAKAAAKKAERAAKKELKKQKKEENKKPKESRALMDTIKAIMSILKSAKWGVKFIFRHIIFYRVRIYISVSEPDASQTAQSYGKMCALIYPGVQLFREIFVLREPDIIIAPDFLSEKSRYDVSFRARIMPIVPIIALTDAFIKYIQAVIHTKEERRKIKGTNKANKTKDRRKKYEPATSGK